MNSSELVQLDLHDPAVATVRLNRAAKRNALSVEMMTAIRRAIADAQKDRARRVLVLRAAGPVFCAGLDLAEVADATKADQLAEILCDLYEELCASPQVTIAVVQGSAVGGGVGLMAACDLVVASDDLKVGFPEVRRGLVAALITALIARQVGDRSMRELILLGQTIDAQRALSLGLVNAVVAPDQIDGIVAEWVRQALLAAPGAVIRTKRLLDALSPRPVAEELLRALALHRASRHDAEAVEGVAAFLEKREPRWGLRP